MSPSERTRAGTPVGAGAAAQTGTVLLPIDAVPFGEGFTRDTPPEGGNPDGEATRASTIKLLNLVEREKIGLVIFGHDSEQWKAVRKLPEYYE